MVDGLGDAQPAVWPIAADMEEEKMELPQKVPKLRKHWQPLFITENFLADKDEITLEAFALKDRKLKMLGQRVTRY